MSAWYVYLLTTASDTLYAGITVDPARRLRQHSGIIKGGAKALRGKSPLKFHCIFEVEDKSTALKLEAWIKQQKRSVKESLARNDHGLPVLATRLTQDAIQQMNSIRR